MNDYFEEIKEEAFLDELQKIAGKKEMRPTETASGVNVKTIYGKSRSRSPLSSGQARAYAAAQKSSPTRTVRMPDMKIKGRRPAGQADVN